MITENPFKTCKFTKRKDISKEDSKICKECERKITDGEELIWNFCNGCKILCLACLEKVYESIDKKCLELAKLNSTNSKI